MCNDRPDYCERTEAAKPTRPTHQEIAELAFEHHEICDRIDKLDAFLNAGAPGVSPKYAKYLHDQLGHMASYARCLNLRMKYLLDSMEESSDSE